MRSNNCLQVDVLIDSLFELLKYFRSNVGVFHALPLIRKYASIDEFAQDLTNLATFLNLHDSCLALTYESLKVLGCCNKAVSIENSLRRAKSFSNQYFCVN